MTWNRKCAKLKMESKLSIFQKWMDAERRDSPLKNRLEALRKARGIKQEELAEALEQSAERLMEPYAVSGRFCFQGVRG